MDLAAQDFDREDALLDAAAERWMAGWRCTECGGSRGRHAQNCPEAEDPEEGSDD